MGMYSDTRPQLGDSDNILLGKILEKLGGIAKPNDENNALLVKILNQLNSVS